MSAFTPSQTRQLLESLGHNPNKKLGQNFLIDGNIVRKSLELAEVTQGDTIIEVGPGLGTLTRSLLKAKATVFAVERDPRLAKHLEQTACIEFPGTLHLKLGDALDFPLALFKPQSGNTYKIVANLPYAIATPWLSLVLAYDQLPERIVVMLQKEAADRYMAKPASKHYSQITIALQSAYTQEPGHNVNRNCFHPIPSVDSALLHLKLKDDPYRFLPETLEAIRFIFTQRRKQIKKLCMQYKQFPQAFEAWLQVISDKGFPPTSRAEVIELDLWQKLDQLIREDLK